MAPSIADIVPSNSDETERPSSRASLPTRSQRPQASNGFDLQHIHEEAEYINSVNRMTQPQDEWKLEQGFAAHELPVLDQTLDEDGIEDDQAIRGPGSVGSNHISVDLRRDSIARHNYDPAVVFAEEREGWRGYIEWEDYPEKRALAHAILTSQKFPPPPEFQLAPVPSTNPVLEGVRWKMWHKAIGGPLTTVPEESWLRVAQEKHKDMLHLLQFPYNGESPKRLMTAKPITPNSLHFVRNHGGIPDIDANKWELRVEGMVKEPKTITFADLQDETKFPRVQKLVTLQCSGTRRLEQILLYPGEGDEMINAPWAECALGTALWEGVTLKSVIKYCGGMADGGKHVELHGADTYFKQNNVMNYLVSVPYSKVKAKEVMLAFRMNGEPLPKIHGYPVRAVVQGYIGARSVKWLYRVRALAKPSRAPVQSKEYLYFNQQVGKHNQSPTLGINIQEMPVSSAIMSPWDKQVVVHNGSIHLKGWAYSGGGRWPERVEVSNDGGFVWWPVLPENMSAKKKWAWRTWEIDLPVNAEGWLELVVRCWDNSLNTQPLEIRTSWNWGLHVTSSCHRIKVYSVNKSNELTARRLKLFADNGESLAPITRPTDFPIMSDEEYEEHWAKSEPRDVDE